jgi:hypothetical protein
MTHRRIKVMSLGCGVFSILDKNTGGVCLKHAPDVSPYFYTEQPMVKGLFCRTFSPSEVPQAIWGFLFWFRYGLVEAHHRPRFHQPSIRCSICEPVGDSEACCCPLGSADYVVIRVSQLIGTGQTQINWKTAKLAGPVVPSNQCTELAGLLNCGL